MTVLNHVTNQSLYMYAIERDKPLVDKMHECFLLLQQIQDKNISGQLYLALTDAVEMAEDNAFDIGAALQAAIAEDELTDREEIPD